MELFHYRLAAKPSNCQQILNVGWCKQSYHTHPLCVTGQHILLGMDNLGCLLLHCLDDMWVAVARRCGANACTHRCMRGSISSNSSVSYNRCGMPGWWLQLMRIREAWLAGTAALTQDADPGFV
jgi:hypothetical protein